MQFYYYSLIAGIVSLVVAIYAAMQVMKKPEGTPKMKEIAKAIKEGSSAYLNRQLQVIAVFAIILAILFYFFLPSGIEIVIAFITGAVASYLTAYLGMNVAVRTNLRTAKAAEKGVKEAFWTGILGGSVTGFAAIGFALIGLSLMLAYLTISNVAILIGFGFGAS